MADGVQCFEIDERSREEGLSICKHNHCISLEEIFGHDEVRRKWEIVVVVNEVSKASSDTFDSLADVLHSGVAAGWSSLSFEMVCLSKE